MIGEKCIFRKHLLHVYGAMPELRRLKVEQDRRRKDRWAVRRSTVCPRQTSIGHLNKSIERWTLSFTCRWTYWSDDGNRFGKTNQTVLLINRQSLFSHSFNHFSFYLFVQFSIVALVFPLVRLIRQSISLSKKFFVRTDPHLIDRLTKLERAFIL